MGGKGSFCGVGGLDDAGALVCPLPGPGTDPPGPSLTVSCICGYPCPGALAQLAHLWTSAWPGTVLGAECLWGPHPGPVREDRFVGRWAHVTGHTGGRSVPKSRR